MLLKLEPARVFYYFNEICKIPHGSGNTGPISEYCENFAKSHGLKYRRDNLNNIIIYKEATTGYEDRPGVIIQGHLDMVCVKNEDVDIDFLRDSIPVTTDGSYVYSNGTSLGGDDGIAVAMALAILEDDSIKHPKLEVVFTTDEETGMYGAAGLDASNLKNKLLINIDSEEEGIITVGCAGGARVNLSLFAGKENSLCKTKKVIISGLLGGHSGIEIHKGRLNAHKLMAEFLYDIQDARINYISGGDKDNAIPSYCECSVATEIDLTKKALEFEKQKRCASDKELSVTVIPETEKSYCFSADISKKMIDLLKQLPNGVIAMSKDIEDFVETSLNMGVLKVNDNGLYLSYSVRSSKKESKEKLISTLLGAAKDFGASYKVTGDYPAWPVKKDSYLLHVAVKTYELLYKKSPKVEAVHAGLECGILSDKISGLDAISIGPDILDIHSAKERLSVESVKRTYEYVLNILERI